MILASINPSGHIKAIHIISTSNNACCKSNENAERSTIQECQLKRSTLPKSNQPQKKKSNNNKSERNRDKKKKKKKKILQEHVVQEQDDQEQTESMQQKKKKEQKTLYKNKIKNKLKAVSYTHLTLPTRRTV